MQCRSREGPGEAARENAACRPAQCVPQTWKRWAPRGQPVPTVAARTKQPRGPMRVRAAASSSGRPPGAGQESHQTTTRRRKTAHSHRVWGWAAAVVRRFPPCSLSPPCGRAYACTCAANSSPPGQANRSPGRVGRSRTHARGEGAHASSVGRRGPACKRPWPPCGWTQQGDAACMHALRPARWQVSSQPSWRRQAAGQGTVVPHVGFVMNAKSPPRRIATKHHSKHDMALLVPAANSPRAPAR